MKILLIGERYSPNLGDGVIYDVVEKICKNIYKENLSEVICLDISGNNSFKQNENSAKTKIKMRFKRLRKVLSKTKRCINIKRNIKRINLDELSGAIFVGGQLFSEYFALPIYIISKELEKHKIPIIFNCCGLGKIDSAKKYLQKTFNLDNIKAISIRDNYKYFQKNYKTKVVVEQIADPVLELSHYQNKTISNQGIIGIGLMEPKLFEHNNIKYTQKEYEHLILNIITMLNKEEIKWEFFCNGSMEDYNYIHNICKYNNISERYICKRPEKPNELIELIAKYEKIISFRLHSHIVATTYNIPSLGFIWDKKIKDYSVIINKEDYFFELDKKNNENIIKGVKKFIKEKNIKKAKTNLKMSSVFLEEHKFGEK